MTVPYSFVMDHLGGCVERCPACGYPWSIFHFNAQCPTCIDELHRQIDADLDAARRSRRLHVVPDQRKEMPSAE